MQEAHLSKADLLNILREEDKLDNEAHQELDYAFKTFDFGNLKSLYPNNIELSRINSEFDSYYKIVGRALNILDNDFALEVLTINGLRPDKLEQDIVVYRGISKNLSLETIDSFFKYGYRAFSYGDNQKFLGFYAENAWNDAGGSYEYGGTYVSLSPDIGAAYAFGGLLFEIKAPINSFKLCGSVDYYKEAVLNFVRGEEIIAVYAINNRNIDTVYKNPYLKESISPTLQVNQSSFSVDWQDTYDSLGCKNIPFVTPSNDSKRMGIYKDYEDFIEHYTPENYASDKMQLIADYFADRELYVEDFYYGLQGECNLAIECCK